MTSKLLMPWEEIIDDRTKNTKSSYVNVSLIRKDIEGNIIERIGWNRGCYVSYMFDDLSFENEKSCKEMSDQLLVKEGYILLTQEQAERFKILI